ncbi:glucose-6-phosphate dehydrogenase [Candidatus Aerophobetes bacterium]|uniref:Glucose-6-phosphate 1-dehydrogenase n=1 Tax=Aerophobetes bacterium TaxID=2030807 RepID=A0A2A4WX56_UNCAE|nr:MAG: glucose-6-phosphate dehydrogenase [Candidatus Aerophobetes bacterium]
MPSQDHPFEDICRSERSLDPCILVIFGASGDLTARKLMPAIYNLKKDGSLPPHFVCVGFARRKKTHEEFRNEMREAISKHSRSQPLDKELYDNFEKEIYYHASEFDDDEGYASLKKQLAEFDQKHGTKGNRLFYLSTQPTFFPKICEKLKASGLLYDENKEKDKWSRVIIEKPFGHDLDSAIALQKDLMNHMTETQLWRIDHYLGKETVQNILVFRFANSIFENLWNHRYIENIQITVAESIGIGTRGKFYEQQGLVRDIMQNHMMQLLCLITMEPPSSLSPKAIHDEKVKVLEAIRPFKGDDFKKFAIRGQYSEGFVDGEDSKAYRGEDNVDAQSNVETFAAVRLFIDNWRWHNTPIYLRGAKRMPKRSTEIAITFKKPPGILFQSSGSTNHSNVLAIRIQPDEGISLKTNCKVPGPSSPIQPVKMDFRYASFFGMAPPEAYERLICDCIFGDNTLFTRQDEVFLSWRFFTPILEHWAKENLGANAQYKGGSWGPKIADDMIKQDGYSWRLI